MYKCMRRRVNMRRKKENKYKYVNMRRKEIYMKDEGWRYI